ncbi:Peptidase C39 [Ruminococcaceae bacterium BL-6]|nr:Peptidase C39 [Ruminococcaceae bacterium BL-6]
MKNPLSYQTTEYDCGPTTMINAIRYLFRREEIPPDVVKSIMLYCLDSYNDKGESGKSGTSGMAMMFLSNWLNQFGRVKGFPIRCEFLTGRDVSFGPNSRIVSGLQQGGAVVLRVRYQCWHYVLLTGVREQSFFLFDPYYRRNPFKAEGIEMIRNMPAERNRKVSIPLVESEGKGYYAAGPVDGREAVILFNRRTQKTPADTIEYFI